METKEKKKETETELVQLVRQLRDYVILDRKDYEKLVQNSNPEKFNESALEARDASEITLYLMFNREFMNDVYRTFRIISRGL